MKLVFAFLAVLGLSYALPANTYGLKDDLDDFLALIPKEELIALYHKYENDPDVLRIVAYLKSEDFAKVVHIIAHNPEVQDLVNYIENQGVPVKELLNKLADRLGLPHWPAFSNRLALRSTRSIKDIIEEAKQLINVDELMALVMDKLANSEAFQELYMKISEVDYQKLHDEALSHPEIQELLARLNNLGVDTKKIWEFVKTIFGWSYYNNSVFATRGLKDDLEDFLSLIPTEKLVALYHKYENDPDVQKVIAYLKSSDFAAVVDIIVRVPEVREIAEFAEGKGVPVKEIFNKIADRLGLPHWPGYSNRFALKSTRSIRDFIQEALALIDTDALIGMVLDKLSNSEDFQELYTKISEVDYNSLHDEALSHPEIRDLLARVNAMGIDTKKIWELVKTIFGWE